jgi:hypothetical protein
MKAQLLAMSGCKTEKEFYKKYPTPEAFEKMHGKELKKAKIGALLKTGKNTQDYSPISYQDNYDALDLALTGSTQASRDEAAYRQTMLESQNQSKGGMADILGQLTPMLGNMSGEDVPVAQNGFQLKKQLGYNNGFNPGNFNASSNIGYTPMGTGLTSSGFQMPNIAQKWGNNNSLPFNDQSFDVPKSIGYNSSNFGKIGEQSTLSKIGGAIGEYAGPAMDIIQGIEGLSAEKEQLKVAEQEFLLADLAEKAMYSFNPNEIQREYVRPEDMIVEGNQLNPTRGRGISAIGRNGLNIKNNVPQMQLGGMLGKGGGMPWDMLGGLGSNIGGSIVGNDAGSNLGGAIGGGLGMFFGPAGSAIGKTLGTIAGGLYRPTDKEIKQLKQNTSRKIAGLSFNKGMQSLRSGPFLGKLENGANLEENYTPVNDSGLETFDLGNKIKVLSGGRLDPVAQNPYLPGSGEIGIFKGKSHEDGGMDISLEKNTQDFENKKQFDSTVYAPDANVETNELVYTDKNGDTNIAGNLKLNPKIATSFNPELATLVKEFGGQRVKNITKSIAFNTNKINKKLEKINDKETDNTRFGKLEQASLNKMTEGLHQQLKIDANKLTLITDYQNQINDTAKQISQHLGYPISASELASKGKIVEDKNPITKDSVMSRNGNVLEDEDPTKKWNFKGTKTDKLHPKILEVVKYLESKGIQGHSGPEGGYSKRLTKQGKPSEHSANQALDAIVGKDVDLYQMALNDPALGKLIYESGLTIIPEKDKKTKKKTGATVDHYHIGGDRGTPLADAFRKDYEKKYKSTIKPNFLPLPKQLLSNVELKGDIYSTNTNETPTDIANTMAQVQGNPFSKFAFSANNPANEIPEFKGYIPKYADTPQTNSVIPQETSRDYSPWINLANSVLGEFTPSNARPLDYNQISDAVQMLATNHVDSVQAQQYVPQQYVPQLDTFYSQSNQDSVNEITAAMRAAQKMALGNVGAEAFIAGQAYEPLNKIKAEEFRINQALADKVFTNNRTTMNDAQIKNLGILDQQYVRQNTAQSNKDAIDFAARKDISNKYQQNALENAKMKIAETYSKYRFDNNGRIRNWNGLANFNVPQVYNGESEDTEDGLLPIYGEDNKTVKGYTTKKATKNARNGSIVKSFKNS